MKKVVDYYKNSKYRIFLLIYVLILAVLLAVIFSLLWTYLSKYEEYNPEKTVKEYIEKTPPEYWNGLLQDRYTDKTTVFENTDEIIEKLELNNIDAENLTYYKSIKEYTDDTPVYNIYYKNKAFAVVDLKVKRDVFLGLSEWEVDNTCLSINDEEINSVSVGITVPPETFVKVNGVQLDSSYITNGRVEYGNISEFEKGVDGVPYRVKYTVKGLFDMPEITAFDKNNKSLPVDIAEYEFYVGSESTLTNNVEVTLPTGYSLYLNNVKVSDEYISNKNSGYSLLDDVDGFDGVLPTMCTYTIKGLYLKPKIKVQDTNGNEVSLKEKAEETYIYDLQCDDDAKAEHEALVLDFAKSYIKYTANGETNIEENFANLRSYVLSGSSADTLIKNSYNGVIWNNTYTVKYNSLNASNFIVYDDSCFSCDLVYDTDFRLYNYTKHYEGSFKLVFVKTNGSFKLSKMIIIK